MSPSCTTACQRGASASRTVWLAPARTWTREKLARRRGAAGASDRALAGEKARRLAREAEVRRYGREALLAHG